MAKNIFSTNYTLGILGGGQLGKMMLYTTRKFDIHTKVLDPSPDAPAQFGANEFQVGSLQDYDTVMAFAADCDTVCIEIEAVNVQALRDLRAQGQKVHPNPDSLELIQDKTKQKQFYADHNIPTSRFEMVTGRAGFEAAQERWPLPFVWKAATGGYDGAISLETGKGDFALALGLGFVLIALSLMVNLAIHSLSRTEREGRW